jgi:hypothetical protein
MTSIGPQVAFVDDIEKQIKPLELVLTADIHAGTIFFDASPELNKFPEQPLETVRLLFLDLHYKGPFDAYMSAQWVISIIPPNTKYSLIIWSKDTDKKDELLSVLEQNDLSPTYIEAWQKTDYDLESDDFSEKIKTLIENIPYEEIINEQIVFGEIIDIEDDGLLVNCKLNEENPTFQVRRFDIDLFKNIDINKGVYVKICINTQPGTRRIDIFKEPNDLSERFKVPDYFKGLEGTAFFIED